MRRFGRTGWARRYSKRSTTILPIEGGLPTARELDSNFWFWMTDRPWRFTPEICQAMIDQVLDAMSKALATGVVEYKVGSRSLRRFSLKELQDLLGFWSAQLEEAIGGGRARRAAPTDT